jgi:hypothetical protein
MLYRRSVAPKLRTQLRLRDASAPMLETQGLVCLDDVAGHRLDLFAFEHGL